MVISHSYKRAKTMNRFQNVNGTFTFQNRNIININFSILKVYSARSRHLSIQTKLRKALEKVTCKLQKSTQDERFNVT